MSRFRKWLDIFDETPQASGEGGNGGETSWAIVSLEWERWKFERAGIQTSDSSNEWQISRLQDLWIIITRSRTSWVWWCVKLEMMKISRSKIWGDMSRQRETKLPSSNYLLLCDLPPHVGYMQRMWSQWLPQHPTSKLTKTDSVSVNGSCFQNWDWWAVAKTPWQEKVGQQKGGAVSPTPSSKTWYQTQ